MPAPLPLAHDDPPALGAYRLVARLGSGGMGTVFLARSPGGRTVALKTMHARIAADSAFRTRFRLESDAARVIGGQYGAQVFDADPAAETPWLATEYVLGPPLDDAVELSGPFPEPSVRALGAALCTALGQLHRSDVVHRDLKPSNIMVTAYGPKIIDFGIARALGDERLTHTGAAVGTPAFMSPEQATGREHTPAGDVFALAGVLVFAASGTAPFGHGRPADLLYRVRYEDPDLSRVPQGLAPVLARCLAKDPTRRPTTAELAAHLHDGQGAFADHLPDPVLAEMARRATEVWHITPQRLPPPQEEPPAPPVPAAPATGLSRRRMLTLGGGLAIGAAAAGAGVWALGDGGSGKSEEPGNPKKARRDPVWNASMSDDRHNPLPITPVAAGDLILLAQGNVDAVDPKTGRRVWQADKLGYSWQLAAAGNTAYRILPPAVIHEEEKKPQPLVLATFDLSKGTAHRPFARFTDVDGRLHQNQLLCAADGVLYLAAGRGAFSSLHFLAAQDWSLQAVDVTSGKRRWSTPLPAREDGDERAYFLTSRVVGRHLVTLQEGGEDGVRGVVRDVGTGEVRWQKSLGMDLETIPLAADDTHVYVGNEQLLALRLSDGGTTWSLDASGTDGYFGPPALGNGVVYAVEDGKGLVAVDAESGKRLWTEKTDEGDTVDLTFPPVIGRKYGYYRRGVDLVAIDLSSRATAFTCIGAGSRFFVDRRREMIIALTKDASISGYPLQ